MVDNIIIIVFLGIVLLVGLRCARNSNTMKEYSIANKRYSTPVMVATIFATLIGGGSTIGLSSKVFDIGIIFLITCLSIPLGKILIARYIAPRIEMFRGMITVGDMMESFYGKRAKVVTGIAGTLLSIGYVGAQIVALGYMSNMLLGIPYEWGLILGASVVVLYSSFGGVQAVTATDVVQFAVLILAIPLVCTIGLKEVGGYSALFSAIPASHLSLFPDTKVAFKHLGLFVFWLIPFMEHSFVQRLLMAKDPKQIIDSLNITAITFVPFYLMIGIIGLTALVLFPDIDSNQALPQLINTILPVGIKGIVVAGMFSVIMSTADSDLNASSIAFVHDVVQPLRRTPLSDAQELKLAKAVTAVIGFSAVFAALCYKNIIDLVLAAAVFWAPTVLVPLLAGIFGYRAPWADFLKAMIAGLLTFAFWSFFIKPYVGFDALVPSILANGVVFFLVGKIRSRTPAIA